MTISTSDVMDVRSDDFDSCELQFRQYGGRRAFSGRLRTVRCEDDNVLLRDLLATPGDGQVLVVTGTIGGAFNVVFGSIRQRIVPNHLLGRVMASFRLISWGSLPLGALLGGIVAQTFGLTAVFIGAAVIHLCLLPSRLILTDAFMAEVEEQARANAEAGGPGH